MLNTLINIGKQISEDADRHPWEDFLLNIKVSDRDKDKNHFLLRMVFDLDTRLIRTEDGFLHYIQEKRAEYGLIDILKGHNKAIYVASAADKPEQLAKALFGKWDKEKGFPEMGEFMEAINKETQDLKSTELGKALSIVKPFGEEFYKLYADEKGKLSLKNVQKGSQDLLVAFYAAVNSKEYGWENKPLAKMEGYKEFIERKFLSSGGKKGSTTDERLCYATGELKADTVDADFSGRYNLNKIFQATTVNYAENFDGNNLKKNYQISEEVRQYLDRGSEKVLNDFKVKIGGLDHVCIPRLPIGSDYDIKDYRRIKDRADIIFRLKDLETVLGQLDFQADGTLYWLDFYGFESDGNFLKITDHIRDVSGSHIHRLLGQFIKVSRDLSVYLRGKGVNLAKLYYIIPVRKDLKANHALELCKMILEQRPVRESLLWQYFTDLILCHWFGRYKAYANIQEPKRDDIIDALFREAVFSYQAFHQILKNLNLLIMEQKQDTGARGLGAQIEAQTLQFLDEMGYTAPQRAMFFLGKALKRVVRVQRSEDKSKTALDMVNFNGLDERTIQTLVRAIMEKGRQYSAKHDLAKKLEPELSRFYQFFPGGQNTWTMDGREALFYFLAGYTHFRPKTEEAEPENDSSNQ